MFAGVAGLKTRGNNSSSHDAHRGTYRGIYKNTHRGTHMVPSLLVQAYAY